jgi:hypothetical protein
MAEAPSRTTDAPRNNAAQIMAAFPARVLLNAAYRRHGQAAKRGIKAKSGGGPGVQRGVTRGG